MRSVIVLFLLCLHSPVGAQQLLTFHPADTLDGFHGYTPLRLFPLHPDSSWKGASVSGRGVFALHSYAVPNWGPTRDRANEAVTIGWNPMGRLQPDQPGFWWQYEWGYGQKHRALFELNLDVRDSASLGSKPGMRRISYKMDRKSGRGVSADFAFDNNTFVSGSRSAGDKLHENFLQIAPRANRMRTALNVEFSKLVRYTVFSHSSADTRLFLPMERGVMFSSRLIPLFGAVSDSTDIQMNDMQPGVQYTIKIRNERETGVTLSWTPTAGRRLYWDTSHAIPDHIDVNETLVVNVIMDEGLHAFASVHGRFRETD
jgi:hypothetical protein